MNTRSSHRRHRLTPATTRLPALAELLLHAAERDGGHQPMLVRLRCDGQGDFELGTLPVPHSATDALLGFTAPHQWAMVGVASSHRVHLVDRSGACASAHRPAADLPVVVTSGRRASTDRIDQLCRRALGLSTPPPGTSTAILWASVWLDFVARALTARPHAALSWAAIAARHPAVIMSPRDRTPSAALPPDTLIALAATLTREWPWEKVRAAAAGSRRAFGDIAPDLAGWMDHGLFCRTVVESLPEVDHLLEITDSLLPAELASAVHTVAEASLA